jgi:hypothetical protein
MLSENNVFFNQPDTNSDALFLLLLRIAGISDNEVDNILSVHRQARTRTTAVDSIFKDKTALMAYSNPYMFQALRVTRLYRPMFMHQWQSSVSVVGLPYLNLMFHTLAWLASLEDRFESQQHDQPRSQCCHESSKRSPVHSRHLLNKIKIKYSNL